MTKAVLFDVDGTLIDSNDAHARAWVAALAEAGHPVPFERVRPLIGMGGDRVLPALVPGLRDDAEPGKTITKRRLAIFKERELPHIAPTRGARELLERVRERGARVVVASSAKKAELDDLLARGDLGPLVDVASTSDDAESSKPAPDIVHAALQKAGVEARDAVMVGDTTVRRRGVTSRARRVRRAAVRRQPARDAGDADAIYASRHLRPRWTARRSRGRARRRSRVKILHQERLRERGVPAGEVVGRTHAHAHERRAVRAGQKTLRRHRETLGVDERDVEAALAERAQQLFAVRRDDDRVAVVAQRLRDVGTPVAVGIEQRDAPRRRPAVRGEQRHDDAERRPLPFDDCTSIVPPCSSTIVLAR